MKVYYYPCSISMVIGCYFNENNAYENLFSLYPDDDCVSEQLCERPAMDLSTQPFTLSPKHPPPLHDLFFSPSSLNFRGLGSLILNTVFLWSLVMHVHFLFSLC